MESLKTPPFLLIGCPVIIIIAVIFYATTYSGFHQSALHAGLLDAEMSATESEPGSVSVPVDTLFRQQRMQRAFAELGLSEAQKQQIAVIRKTVTDRGQRHDAIMAVLTRQMAADSRFAPQPVSQFGFPSPRNVYEPRKLITSLSTRFFCSAICFDRCGPELKLAG